jgi:hypothetical protein
MDDRIQNPETAHELALREGKYRRRAEWGFGYALAAAALGDPKFLRLLRCTRDFINSLDVSAERSETPKP